MDTNLSSHMSKEFRVLNCVYTDRERKFHTWRDTARPCKPHNEASGWNKTHQPSFCLLLLHLVYVSIYRSTSLCCCVPTCFLTMEQEEPEHCVVHSERKREKKKHYWRDAIKFDRMELQHEYTIGEFL